MGDDPVQRRKIAELDAVSPRLVRIANATRVVEMQLIISEAMHLIRGGKYDEAYAKLDSARPDFRGHGRIPAPQVALDDARRDARQGVPDKR